MDKYLFIAKQRYMYAVFKRVLQTDKGKALVRLNEATSNTQKIFTELCQDTLRSTHASIDSSRILSYITSMRIGDGLWNGTSHSFVLHWQEQVQLFESLVDMASHFSPEQKMHMLQNAVHPQEELRQRTKLTSYRRFMARALVMIPTVTYCYQLPQTLMPSMH